MELSKKDGMPMLWNKLSRQPASEHKVLVFLDLKSDIGDCISGIGSLSSYVYTRLEVLKISGAV